MAIRSDARRRWVRLGAVVSALAIVAAGCGGDDDGSSNTASVSSEAPSGTEAPSGDSVATGSTDAATGDAAAQLAALLERPTKITNTTPIDAEIPSGKTIMWIQCPVPACVQLGEPLKEAVEALGWTLKIVTHEGTPESLKAAYEQAVREEPDGVVSSGFPRSMFEPELAQLAEKNIPVIQLTTTDPPGDGITAVINGPARNADVGEQLALFVSGDSENTAKVLWVTAAFPILVPALEGLDGSGGFQPTLGSLCPDCTVDSLEMPIESIGTDAPARIVAYLQAHPDVNYVVGAFSDVVGGLSGALADAGLADSVKIATYTQNPSLSAELEQGTVAAVVGFPGQENMWQAADTFARIFAGVEFVEEFNDLPSWIITAGNVPSTTEEYPLVADYQAQYKTLWGLG